MTQARKSLSVCLSWNVSCANDRRPRSCFLEQRNVKLRDQERVWPPRFVRCPEALPAELSAQIIATTGTRLF
jgi:hypothetical protein